MEINMNTIHSTIIVYLVFIINRYCVECGQACSEPLRLKHGNVIDCDFVRGVEMANVECDTGYEFSLNVNKTQVEIFEVIFSTITCTGNLVGC